MIERVEVFGTIEDIENLRAFTSRHVHADRFPAHVILIRENVETGEKRWACETCPAGWRIVEMTMPESRVRELVNRSTN